MTSTKAYNIITSKSNCSISLGGYFCQDVHLFATLYYKRIKEIKNPHDSDEAKMLRDKLILMATCKTIPLTKKKPK